MSRSRWWFLLAVVLISIIFFNFQKWNGSIPKSDDGLYYDAIANNLVSFSRFSSSEHDLIGTSEPGYPLFLSFFYKAFGSSKLLAVRLGQLVLFLATLFLIYKICLISFASEKISYLAAFFTSLFYPLVVEIGNIHREVLFVFLVSWLAYLAALAIAEKKTKWYLFLGLVLGIANLVNAVLQFLFIFLGAAFWFLRRKEDDKKTVLRQIAIFLLTFFIVSGAWMFGSTWSKNEVRSFNLKTGGALSRKAEVMSKMETNIFFRHLIGQTLGYYFVEGENFDPYATLHHKKTTKELGDITAGGKTLKEANEEMAKTGFAYIKNHPLLFLETSILDFLQFNGPMLVNWPAVSAAPAQNLFIGGSHPEVPKSVKISILLILRIFYWLLFALIIFGAYGSKANNRVVLLLVIILYFNLVYLAVFGLPRYSLPIWPIYLSFFSHGLFILYETIKGNKTNISKL